MISLAERMLISIDKVVLGPHGLDLRIPVGVVL